MAYKDPKDPRIQNNNTRTKRANREANREEHTRKNREWNFRRKYGITLDEYDAMRAAQGYRCAICQRHEDELPRPVSRKTTDGIQVQGNALAVDHCHASQRVRKLLCGPCNRGLGCFQDNPERMAAAIKYLGGHLE